jgi:hypothetical protein
MKKFINLPENAVEEALQGLAVLNPGLMRLPGQVSELAGEGACHADPGGEQPLLPRTTFKSSTLEW